MESTPAADTLVCITGATGYIASFVVKLALERGYRVRGTVRSLSNEEKLRHLKEMQGASERLELVEADLNHPHNFASVLEGVRCVLHTATPMVLRPFESEEEMYAEQINPAVEGTKEILRAASQAGVEKVVLTSSVVAMLAQPTPPSLLDESSWSDLDYLKGALAAAPAMPYLYAKTLQEKSAWDLSKELGLKLSTICPHLVVGPRLTPTLNESNGILLNLVAGKGVPLVECPEGTLPDTFQGLVDVREVAQAHVLAMEKESATGHRYLLFSHNVHCQDLARRMREAEAGIAAKYGDFPLHSEDGQRHAAIEKALGFDNSPVRELGVEEIAWEDTVAEAAHAVAPFLADV